MFDVRGVQGRLVSEEAIQLAYGMSVVLLRCSLVPEIIHLKSSSSSIAGRSPYNRYRIGSKNTTKIIDVRYRPLIINYIEIIRVS